jgi:hypothetical protein
LLLELFQFRSNLKKSQFPTGVRHSICAGTMLRSPVLSFQFVNYFDLLAKCLYASCDSIVIHESGDVRLNAVKSPGVQVRGVLLLRGKRKGKSVQAYYRPNMAGVQVV